MNEQVSTVARAAAHRLGPEIGQDLRFQVEEALGGNGRPDQFVDPVALGSLIVSTAALAWMIVKDIRANNLSPSADRVIRQIRIELPPSEHISAETRDKIIDAVVEQLLDEQ